MGAEEAPPQARTRLTRAGIGTAGETAGTGRDGTAGVSSRVTSVAGADGFSVKPTTKLEASNRFRFHTAAQRWAAGMEAETPPPDRQRHSLPSLPGLGPRWFVRKPSKKVAIVAGAVGIGLAALEFSGRLSEVPLPGAVGIGLAAFVAPQGPRTSWAHLEQQARYPFPSLRMSGGCHVTLRAASIGEAAFLFPSAPAPRGEPGKSR